MEIVSYFITLFNKKKLLQSKKKRDTKMIKEIFTWWNSQTIGTRLNTLFFGKLIGKDKLGNK